MDNCKYFNYIGISYFFPLYTKAAAQKKEDGLGNKSSGFGPEIIVAFTERLRSIFVNEEEEQETASPVCFAKSPELREEFLDTPVNKSFSPAHILNYVRAVLHSTTYSGKQKDFLKLKAVGIPYPTSQEIFWKLENLGRQIYKTHLLSFSNITPEIAFFSKGSNLVTRTAQNSWELSDSKQELGRIWINEKQYFDSVPLKAWAFHFGGYRPAFEWIKEHKGGNLKEEEVKQYQKLILALLKIDRVTKEIDKVLADT